MGGGSGVTSDELTAKASDVLQGKTYMGADTGDEAGTGGIPVYAGRTITPGTANQIIAAGQYLSGNVTIAGDADLKAANIKSGVNLFGVAGSCKEFVFIGEKVATSSKEKATFYDTWGGTNRSRYYLSITDHGITPMLFACKSQSTSSVDCMYAVSGFVYHYYSQTWYGYTSGFSMTKSLIKLPVNNYNQNYQYYVVGYR